MKQVMIVDDEILSRLGVVNLLDWEGAGYQVVCDLSNGQEAIERLRQGGIDLVITDIKMPVMDGIELIRLAREEGWSGVFIVLSSFDDYTYVREALTLGAMDYMLKLDMNRDKLMALLERASVQILATDSSETRKRESKDLVTNARREILKQMLFGTVSVNKDQMDDCGLKFWKGSYGVLMFKVERLDNLLGEGSIRQVLESALEDNPYSYLVDTGYDEICILWNFKGSRQDQMKVIQGLCQRISYIMNQYFNQSIQIFSGRVHDTVEAVSLAYLEVTQAFSLRSYANDALVVTLEEVMESRHYRDYQNFEQQIKDVERVLVKGDSELFTKVFNDFIDSIERAKYIEVSQVRHGASSLIFVIEQHLEKLGLGREDLWRSGEADTILKEGYLRKAYFIGFLKETGKGMAEILDNLEDNHIVRNVKRYLHQHFRENIVIKDLPDNFGVTSAYLSMLFKQETGITLKEFLIKLKIDKAKELLKETNMQVIEISDTIGYDNEHYFSRLFKQKVGITPSQYRNKKDI